MTLELFESLAQAEPFVPYTLHLVDGRTIAIGNPEIVMIAGDNRSISVFEPNRATEYIDLALVVSARLEDPDL